jgi:hypothetical protein
MRRVKEFFRWEEQRWNDRAVQAIPGADTTYVEGQRAYAFRQAAIRSELKAHCDRVWKDLPEYILLGTGLPEGTDGQEYRVECH